MGTAAAALVISSSAFGAPPDIRRDVNYAQSQDPKQVLDLYLPDGAKKNPIVVWIHGGGWASGDKADNIGPKSQACVQRGFVFASLNYRLFYDPSDHPGATRPAITIPDIEADLAKAIRWLRDNAASFGGDPDLIIVMGHSAGAQLAALLCTDEKYLGAEGLTFAPIKGCIPIDGDTYYPTLQVDLSTPRQAAGKRPMFPDVHAERELSPVLHAKAGKGIPPFLIIHVADFPETGTALQSEVLAYSLLIAGVPAKLYPAAGKTHLTLDADLGKPEEPMTRAMLDFIDGQVFRVDFATWGHVPAKDTPERFPSDGK
jgi:arylformamidase